MRGEADAPRDLPQASPSPSTACSPARPRGSSSLQAEDLTGALDQVNVPGTTGEHPNWRRKLALRSRGAAGRPLFRAITEAVRAERPR